MEDAAGGGQQDQSREAQANPEQAGVQGVKDIHAGAGQGQALQAAVSRVEPGQVEGGQGQGPLVSGRA